MTAPAAAEESTGRVPAARWELFALAFAMTYPVLMTWLYFIGLAGTGTEGNPAVQVAALCGKALQVSLPVAVLFLADRSLVRFAVPTTRGLGLALGFGVFVAAGMLGLYYAWLRGSDWMGDTPQRIVAKVNELGAGSPAGFLALAAFVALAHSWLEEYYWRWFVFRLLLRHISLMPAIVLSSLGFLSYHVIILWVYMSHQVWTLVAPFSLAVFLGGVAWAWLYHRSRSLLAVWLSHVIVDLALMWVGYDLIRPYLH